MRPRMFEGRGACMQLIVSIARPFTDRALTLNPIRS